MTHAYPMKTLFGVIASLAVICNAIPAASGGKNAGPAGPLHMASIVAAGPPPQPSIELDVVSQTVTYSDGSSNSRRATESLERRTDGACDPLPAGMGPLASPDTPAAFLALTSLSSIASAALTPSGYVNTFRNLQAQNNAMGYLGYYLMDSYNVDDCASSCDKRDGCVAFNTAFERAPSVDPSPGCKDPASTTLIKCVLWGGPVSRSNAVNDGQWRGDFHVVVAGSNGYVKHEIQNAPGYTDPNYLGDAAINAPAGCNGADSSVGYEYWNDGQPFSASRCSQACDSNSQCQFFNTFVINKNGQPQGQYCALYSQTWSSSFATLRSFDFNGDTYSISYSFFFAKSDAPKGCKPPNTSHVGCFRDSPDRLFPVSKNGDGPMTLEQCAALCSDYKYYGVEYASECFCGNSIASATPSDNCNMNCRGNSQQACGGGWAIDVYTQETTPTTSATSSTSSSTSTSSSSSLSVSITRDLPSFSTSLPLVSSSVILSSSLVSSSMILSSSYLSSSLYPGSSSLPTSLPFTATYIDPTYTVSLLPTQTSGFPGLPCPTNDVPLGKRQFYPPSCFEPCPLNYDIPMVKRQFYPPSCFEPCPLNYDIPMVKRQFYPPSCFGPCPSNDIRMEKRQFYPPSCFPGPTATGPYPSGTPPSCLDLPSKQKRRGGDYYLPPFCTYPPITEQPITSTAAPQPTGVVDPAPSCKNPSSCGGYTQCNPGADCYCGFDSGNKAICFQNEICSYSLSCSSNLECNKGWSCLVASCCGYSLCAPTSVCAAQYPYNDPYNDPGDKYGYYINRRSTMRRSTIDDPRDHKG